VWGGEVGGGLLDATGVGRWWAVGLIANGVVGAAAGFGILAHAMSMSGENEGGGGGGGDNNDRVLPRAKPILRSGRHARSADSVRLGSINSNNSTLSISEPPETRRALTTVSASISVPGRIR
jgi:hypothetical protein